MAEHSLRQRPPPSYDLQRSDGTFGGGGGVVDQHHRHRHIGPSHSVDYSEATGTTATGAGGGTDAPSSSSTSPPDDVEEEEGMQTTSPPSYRDSTETVREMHLALLHLLSNPDEFQRAASYRGRLPDADRSSLASWSASYDDGATDVATDPGGGGGGGAAGAGGKSSPDSPHPPLPYLVFAEDAEVVLPQAHTASQLFGLERAAGIELEAAAGVPALSQLFLRWLALMPGGEHTSVIDPPGLTVMRIAGGRYRCTAAHRAVWTWSTEFLPEVFGNSGGGGVEEGSNDGDGDGGEEREKKEGTTRMRRRRRSGGSGRARSVATSPAAAAAAVAAGSVGPVSSPRNSSGGGGPCADEEQQLHMGDLVCMTVVDVFETDTDGRLLSYCPTFDNRDIRKTNPAAERLRKGGESMKRGLTVAARSTAAARVNQAAGILGRIGLRAAASVKDKIVVEIQHRKDSAGAGTVGTGGANTMASPKSTSSSTSSAAPPNASDAAREASLNGGNGVGQPSDGEGAGAAATTAMQQTPGVAVDATAGGKRS